MRTIKVKCGYSGFSGKKTLPMFAEEQGVAFRNGDDFHVIGLGGKNWRSKLERVNVVSEEGAPVPGEWWAKKA